MKKGNLYRVIFFLATLLIILAIISLGIGRYNIKIKTIIEVIYKEIFSIGNIDGSLKAVIFNVRLPRIIFSILIGSSLSISGLCYQGIFKNPLVSSDVIGASSGASFGAAFAIVMGYGRFWIAINAFAWSLIAVFTVYIFSKKISHDSVLGMVLSGITIGSLFKSALSFVKIIADPMDELPRITYWLMGSLAGTKLKDILPVFVLIIIATIPLWLLKFNINIITMGDEEAISMGVNTKVLRIVVIICSTILTAVCISISGIIGWISLAIPHFSKLLVGNDYRKLMPVTMLMGANFLLLIDNISRITFSTEIPLSILTSVAGVPIFLYILYRRKEIL